MFVYFLAAGQSLAPNKMKIPPEIRGSFAPFISHNEKILPSRIFKNWK